MEKIKKIFFYAGIEQDKYTELKWMIREENCRYLRYYSLILFVGMLLMLLVSCFEPSLVKNRALYGSYAGSFFIILLVSILAGKKITSILIYIFEAAVLFFGISLATIIDPSTVAVIYPVILFAIPLIFTDRPLVITIFITLSIILFFILASVTQTPEIMTYNATNIIPVGLLSIASSIFIMKVKIERLALRAENHALKEAASLIGKKKRNSKLEALGNFVQAVMVFNSDESEGHCKRVRQCAQIIANCYNHMNGRPFSEEDLELIEIGAQIHDIGKIYIPKEIITKKEALTDEEKTIIKNHTIVGADLVDCAIKITGIETDIIHNIVLYHHERWDGSGYPENLAGEAIPLEAQIVGAAEVYDVLSTKGYSHDQVIEMIMNGACGAFSDKIKKCLVKAKEELKTFYDNRETQRWDLLSGTYRKHSLLYWRVKRICDVVLSLLALVVLSPLLLAVCAWIKIDDPKSPVFFKQVRLGRHKKEFEMYKFRTMVPNAEALLEKLKDENEKDGPVFKIKNDPRITKPGRFLRKTSIDELPQLINIIKGDMTIVGPRPPLPSEVANYSNYHEMRLSVTPGLTCIWQSSDSRDDISFEDWMDMDVVYVGTRSLATDFKIILKTATAVLKGTGH